jgi:glycosyltransferase involved in cell wall biosynthesis
MTAAGLVGGPRVLVFGTYDARAHPRVQVIIDGLRAHGMAVEECNAPLGLDTAARVALLQQPWRLPALPLRIAARWAALSRRARRLPSPDVVVVPYLGHFDVHLARRLFRGVPIVLDHFISGSDTARDRGVSGPGRDALLTFVDHAALRAADMVILDTEEHRDLMPAWARSKGMVVPIGAPDDWEAPPRPPYDGLRPLKVIFFGLFTPLQGTVVIGEALGRIADQPQIEVTMAGGGQELVAATAAARANPQVRWLGMVPAEQMPALAAEHDVCLGIFGTGAKGLRVVPNKVYQGIRAGCAIVTSDTPPQRRVLGDLAVYVKPGDPDALAQALRKLAADPKRVAALQGGGRAASDRFGPAGVVGELVRRLEEAHARGSGGDRQGSAAPLPSVTDNRGP